MNIVYRYGGGQFVVRAEQRIKALRAAGAQVLASEQNASPAMTLPPRFIPNSPRILVMQRMGADFKDWPSSVKALRQKGWLIIFDTDDSPEFIHARLKSDLSWEEYQQQRMATVLHAHALQVSTKRLGTHMQKWHDHIHLVPNALFEMGPWDANPLPAPGDPVRIVYAGTPRASSFQNILPALERIEAEHEVTWVFMCRPDFSDAFKDAVRPKRLEAHGIGDYDQYLKTLRSGDIAISPLDRTPGHEHKSDIKYLEATSQGLPMIASPTVYGDTIQHGKTGVIADTVRDWYFSLRQLIERSDVRFGLWLGARDYVLRERMMRDTVDDQLAWFEDLWANRQKIDQDLINRAARLGRPLA